MNNINIQKANVNIEALDTALRTALGTTVSGISCANGDVIVHLADSATPTQIQQAQQIVTNHDAAVLTPAQQAAQQQEQQLEQLRETAGGITLQPSDFSSQPQAIQNLMEKVRWLEQEVLNLRQQLGIS